MAWQERRIGSNRRWRSLGMFGACWLLMGAVLADSADPIEGLWLGKVGTAKEQIEVGLEFRRNATGGLELRLTQPISNYYDEAAPGVVQRTGDQVSVAALAMRLTLQGEQLVGTYPGPNSQARFERVQRLPKASPPPKLPLGPEPRWQTRLGAQIYASPVVADGVVYLGNSGGVFNAVKVSDGSLVWAKGVGGAILGDALVAGSAVYFVADTGFLYKLNRRDGQELWRYELGDATVDRVMPHPQVFEWDWQAPKPVLADGVIHVGAGDGGFHAVDASTGKRKWRFETRGRIRNSAAINDDRVVFGSSDHFVYALRRDNGQEVWRFDSGAAIDATPVVAEGKVLVGNRGGGLYALNADTGVQDWRLFFWGSWVESTPVVADGVIYIGSSDLRRVSAINLKDGSVRWRTDVYGWSWGTPLLTADAIYVGTAGGEPYFIKHVAALSKLDRTTGRMLERRPLPDAGGHQWGIAGSAQLADQTLVVATIEGSLFGYPNDAVGSPAQTSTMPGKAIAVGVTLIPGGFVSGRQPDGNTVVFQAPDGLVVLDSGRHPEHSQQILDYAAAANQPIAVVLNSHWHLDHISGNPRLRQAYPTLRVFASPAIEGAMAGFLARSRRDGLKFLAEPGDPVQQAEVRADIASIESGPALYPDTRITAAGTRDFAGLSLQVGYAAHSVTEADLWFYEPTSRVLAVGDLVTLPAPFFDTACPAQWQQSLAALAVIPFETLVPGHGPAMTRAEFERYRHAFDQLLSCAASKQEAASCIAAWQHDAAGWLVTEADRKLAAGLLNYYFETHLRAPAAQQVQWCATTNNP